MLILLLIFLQLLILLGIKSNYNILKNKHKDKAIK